VTVESLEFTLSIPSGPEVFPNLSMEARHSRYFATIAASSAHVNVSPADPPSPIRPPDNRPAEIPATPLLSGRAGQNDDPSALGLNDFRAAISALERVREVTMLCIPDGVNPNVQAAQGAQGVQFTQDVQSAMIEHCERMQNRFAILDPRPNLSPTAADGIRLQRQLVGSARGYGALYYPQIFIAGQNGSGRIRVPPSGHIAGVYANVDADRGVHKAPANVTLGGARSLELTLTDDEQGPLNEQGINVLRSFPGRGVVVWGARTIAPPNVTQWRYVNVRRLLLFIEESIKNGTAFAVFEPNNPVLWQKVKRQLTDFLTRVANTGALVGDPPFKVKIDEELNPPALIALGQLVAEIELYPTPPAEFIVFRIIQQPGGPTVEE
jgi:phage tail sheath protein FI